ncbi:hypothetical protein, partial [Mesorhizobium sp.]|uniref:hypothetical protein n=1 Tax=Mesorhizobium sp. TaxID=1871066 RepID=UPI0025C43FB7
MPKIRRAFPSLPRPYRHPVSPDYRAERLPFGFRIANGDAEPYVWSRRQATMTPLMARAFLFVLD